MSFLCSGQRSEIDTQLPDPREVEGEKMGDWDGTQMLGNTSQTSVAAGRKTFQHMPFPQRRGATPHYIL